MAVELCKVNLWLEALEPGRPLSFLDHHIRCGNALLGATPALLRAGVPDAAFEPIEGDDPEYCRDLRRWNKSERQGHQNLFTAEPWERIGDLATGIANLDQIDDSSLDGVREKECRYAEIVRSAGYEQGHLLADAWCATFVWPKTHEAHPIGEDLFRAIERNPMAVAEPVRKEIRRFAEEYRFFHWHLAFPDIFYVPAQSQEAENVQTGWNGGFDLILGNPPWDKVQPEEVKFFAETYPDIAYAKTSALRKELIDSLAESDPRAFANWKAYKRNIEVVSHLIKDGGLLPLTSEGNLNTYRLFTELGYRLVSQHGRCGLVVQTGIATDESGKEFFSEILSSGRLLQFLDFENRSKFFPDVDSRFRFALITVSGSRAIRPTKSATFGWLLHELSELESPERLIRLSYEDVLLFNPTTGTCPVFQSNRDLTLSRGIYQAAQHIYVGDSKRFNNVDFLGELFNMTRDSRLFQSDPDTRAEYFPLYEAKAIHQFDHRYASVHSHDFLEVSSTWKQDPAFGITPRSWVLKSETVRRTQRRQIQNGWMLGFRDISRATDERSAIFSVLPFSAVGNNINLVLGLTAQHAAFLCANGNSFAFDFACRQKMSGMHLNIWIMKQLPAIRPEKYDGPTAGLQSPFEWVIAHTLELVYTAWDLQPFAAEVGWDGSPFRWDDQRRFLIRCELDALYFHLYEVGLTDVDYIMDTFPIARRNDESEYGEYRTKRVILEIYNRMQCAIETGQPYQTLLDPPPADSSCRHPRKKIGILAFGSLINDPGDELKPKITMRIKTNTPFGVEYGRYSGKTRGGAPTLVPHVAGTQVAAEILVLDDAVTTGEGRDLLWRRETRKTGTLATYVEGTSENSVLVKTISDSPWVETLLYTDFPAAGKITNPNPTELAERAVRSFETASPGMDGISYLIAAMGYGIQTPLTVAYRDEILRQTKTDSLNNALDVIRSSATRKV
jgi:hypothetical protein